jgi:DNA repair protein RecN (Recombination protein N)
VIQKLFIENYAIIDELEIDFSNKLNVITGETGAGKSIIVGALGLILGERADSTSLVNKEKKCFVEGTFDVRGKEEVKHFLEKNDFDEGDQLIIRREISTSGKSRAFVNDSPVTLSQLNVLSSLLVDLHRQFDTLQLEQGDFQREVIDAIAAQSELLNAYQLVFKNWQTSKKELEALNSQKQQFEKEFDYNQFQYDELDEAAFKENELENLEKELKLLNNSEGIKTVLSKTQNDLTEGENPFVPQLKILVNQLQAYSSYHPDIPLLLHRLQSVQIELQDISDEVEHMNDHINYDPRKVEEIDNRLSSGYKLFKKHGVKTTNELLVIKQQLEKKLQAVLEIGEQLESKGKETERLFSEAMEKAAKISENRKRQIKPLEEKVNELLAQVGMPNAKMKVELENNEGLNFYGSDKVEFLFDANLPAGQAGKGGQFQPIRKVASGGELNRLMLCIKSLIAQSVDLPTMIFDEIDTGISGEAARQVGIIMKELASKRQVICITHQPQIAGKGDAHFFVYKDVVKDSVKTNIRQLTSKERITAIARMLSGEKPTAAAMENAREMVMN